MFGMGNRHATKDVPIGIDALGERDEFDSMGSVQVPACKYWGAQTQRSLIHFSIGNDRMPKEVYHAYGIVKKACALVNEAGGRLPKWKADAIVRAADETIAGKLDDHYPLYVWQTGSGTQSNMNVNEVLSNRSIQLLGGTLGSQQPVAPNDDVNMGRWLASGPRCGLGELLLPGNEPGSSIMPGKVNPTQCEAVVMIAIQVIGEDTAVAFAGSQGNFELNAMRAVIISNFLHSARILGDGCEKFRLFSVEGTRLNEKRIARYFEDSVMLVTALSPVIGYEKAAHIAQAAIKDGSTLRAAAIASGEVDEATYDKVMEPMSMVGHGAGGA